MTEEIFKAVLKNDINKVKEVIKRNCDAVYYSTAAGITPLMEAVRIGNIEIVKSLLEAGARLTDKDVTGCGVASYINPEHEELIETLEQAQKQADLFEAIRDGSFDKVCNLLRYGAKADGCDHQGQTPLLKAIEMGNKKIVKKLIDFFADINMPNKHGEYPITEAVYQPSTHKIAKVLIKAGANLNVIDKYGDTPLDFAYKCCYFDMCLKLNKAGAKFSQNLKKKCKTKGE